MHIEGAGGGPSEQGWAPGAFLEPVLPDFSGLRRASAEGPAAPGRADVVTSQTPHLFYDHRLIQNQHGDMGLLGA